MVMRAFARSIRPCSRTSGRTVRDREAPGSNPGPPTIFVFKIGDFRVSLESAAHSRITISYGEPNRGGINGAVVGHCEIAGQRTGGHAASQAGGRTGQDREAPGSNERQVTRNNAALVEALDGESSPLEPVDTTICFEAHVGPVGRSRSRLPGSIPTCRWSVESARISSRVDHDGAGNCSHPSLLPTAPTAWRLLLQSAARSRVTTG